VDIGGLKALAPLYGSPPPVGRGPNVRLRCPFAAVNHKHPDDPSPDLSVKVEDGAQSVARCFSCGVAGSLLNLFTDACVAVGGGELDAAVEYIAATDKGGLGAALARLRTVRDRVPGQHTGSRRDPPTDLERYVLRCARQVPRYLIEQRGVVKADVERWKIGFDADLRRAVFPCWDSDHNLVGASRRTVCNAQPKFYDTPGPWKQEVWYGEHLLDATREHAVVVEGVLGTVFASRVLPNVLGLLGAHTGLGGARLAKLRRWCRVVTLLLDADEAGDRAVHGYTDAEGREHLGLRAQLRPFFVVRVARLPREYAGTPVKDPADIPGDVLARVVQAASYIDVRSTLDKGTTPA